MGKTIEIWWFISLTMLKVSRLWINGENWKTWRNIFFLNVWWLYSKENIKEIIGIKKFDINKNFIDADDKLPEDITLKKSCDINYMYYKKWL